MPILIDKQDQYTGKTTVYYRNGAIQRLDSPSGYMIEFREGTGPRKKPYPIDETPYIRRSIRLDPAYGSGIYKPDSWPNPQKWEGALHDFAGAMAGSLQRPSWDLDTNLVDQANLSALGKLDRRDIDLGTAWAERGKTAQLLANLAEVSVDVLKAARKGRGRDILDMFGLSHDGPRGTGFVDAWLAYRYGVRPLVNDVTGAAKALARKKLEDWEIVVRGSAKRTSTRNTVLLSVNRSFECQSQLSLKARVKIRCVPNPEARRFDTMWSLGLDNPIATAWELAPYSFVLDWAMPIGQWLQALNSVKYYTGWRSTLSNTLLETARVTGASGRSGSNFHQGTCRGGGYRAFVLERRVVPGLPLLGLPIKDPRSLTHMADSLSLFASHLARGEQRRFVRY